MSYLCCFVLSSFLNFLFHTAIVFHFCYLILFLFCTFNFSFHVPRYTYTGIPVLCSLIIYVPWSYVLRSLCSLLPPPGPPNTFYPPVFVRCFVLLLSSTFDIPQYLCSPIPMFPRPMFPDTYMLWSYVPQSLCSPIPMFPDTYITWSYVSRSLCSPVPMFPDLYVPGSMFPDTYIIFMVLCSQVSMFPITYVPRCLYFMALCSLVSMFPSTYVPQSLCFPVPMLPRHSHWYLLLLFRTFINLHFRCFEHLLFCTFVV